MYVAKLEEMKKMGGPVELRAANAAALPGAAASLRGACQVGGGGREGLGWAGLQRSPGWGEKRNAGMGLVGAAECRGARGQGHVMFALLPLRRGGGGGERPGCLLLARP